MTFDLSLCVCVCAHMHVGACVVFVGFYVLAGLWFIFGLDLAALVLSGYVLFSLVHLSRHLTCPEINTRTHFHTHTHTHTHTSTHRKERDSVMSSLQSRQDLLLAVQITAVSL